MIIAVDFDGTIVEHRFPNIGKPIPFAIETLIRLTQEGHKVILWSVREGQYLEEAVQFCHDNGLDFYAVNSEYPGASWSGSGVSRKLKADVYIDDRNVGGLPDWSEVYELVTKRKFAHPTHKHKKTRRGLLRRLIERTRAARARYNR